jgi:nitrogenase-stabilizing/protective protein
VIIAGDPLAQLARAEEFFEALGVPYDPRVVTVYRLRLLKRFGLEVAAIDAREPRPAAAERLRLCADALRRAHDQFAAWLDAPARPAPGSAACASSCACEAVARPRPDGG